jgi:hypothetical protein
MAKRELHGALTSTGNCDDRRLANRERIQKSRAQICLSLGCC